MSSSSANVRQLIDQVDDWRTRMQDTALRLPLGARFTWQGNQFHLQCEAAGAEGMDLTLEACLGAIPYSGEDLAARKAALDCLSARWRDARTEQWLLENGTAVRYQSTTRCGQVPSISTLLAMLTVILLEAGPRLDALTPYLRQPR